jgi:hypothetical protein
MLVAFRATGDVNADDISGDTVHLFAWPLNNAAALPRHLESSVSSVLIRHLVWTFWRSGQAAGISPRVLMRVALRCRCVTVTYNT